MPFPGSNAQHWVGLASTAEEEGSSPETSMDSPLAEEENSHPHGRDFPEVGNSLKRKRNKQVVVSLKRLETLISKLNLMLGKPTDSPSQEKESDGEDGGEEGSGSDPRRGPRTVSEVEGDQGVDQNNDGQSRVTASEVGETSQIDDTHPGLLASIGNSPLTMKRKWHGEEYPAGSDPLGKLRAVSVVEGDQFGDQDYCVQSELTASEVGGNSNIDRTHSAGSHALMNDLPPRVDTFSIGSDYTHGVGSEFDESSGKWKDFIIHMAPGDQGGNHNNGAQSALTASEVGETSHMDDANSGLFLSTDNSPPMKRKWREESLHRTAGSDPRRTPRTAFVLDEGDEGGDQNYGGQSEPSFSEVGGILTSVVPIQGSPALITHSPPRVYTTAIGSDYRVGVGYGFDASGKWREDIMQPDQCGNQNNGARAMEPGKQLSLLRTRLCSSVKKENSKDEKEFSSDYHE